MNARTYLVGDVGTSIADIAVHLTHHSDVLIAVEQRILVVFGAGATSAAMCRFVSLETRVRQHDYEALRVFVSGGDGVCLLGN